MPIANGATAVGGVRGTVIEAGGKPVAGARVFISQALGQFSPKFTAPPVITGPFVTSTYSNQAGVFQVDNLPPGAYVACAQTKAPGLLDPCHWATAAPTFSVAAASVAQGVTITMAKGAVVTIRISDPQHLLKANPAALDFELQFHAITKSGFRHTAAISGDVPGTRDHALTLPYGSSVTLQILAPHLLLSDSNGKALSDSAATTVSIGSATDPPPLLFNVIGTK